jgi:gephyrin
MPPSKATQKAAILIISDTAFADSSTDKAGPTLLEVFSTSQSGWEVTETKIVPDDVLEIQRAITNWSDREGEDGGIVNCVITSGGTGFAVRDRTPEVSRFERNEE